MKINIKNKHSPCTMCCQKFGYSYDENQDVCQRCEYNISIQLLKRILKCEDSCSLCSNRILLVGGYLGCKNDKQDTCCSDDYAIDWEAVCKDYLSINEWKTVMKMQCIKD